MAVTLVAIIVAVSGKYIGGRLRFPIVLSMLGLAVMYVGDVVFGYTTTTGSFYNANWGDLILLAGMTAHAISLLAYGESAPQLKQAKGEQ